MDHFLKENIRNYQFYQHLNLNWVYPYYFNDYYQLLMNLFIVVIPYFNLVILLKHDFIKKYVDNFLILLNSHFG